jgi:hypothetical protein
MLSKASLVDEKNITQNVQPPALSVSWLDTVERISRTASIAAIPIVLAVGGWVIQRQLQNQTLSRDYVQLALTILQNPDQSKVPPELREWAVDLLNDNSPTKLNQTAVDRLKSGAVSLAPFKFVPSSALTPTLKTELEASLNGFQDYMVKLGFTAAAPSVSVEIPPGNQVQGWVARWEPATSSIVVASAFAGDRVTVLRQLAHQFLFSSQTQSAEYQAMESGLATYFPCSFVDHPIMGDQASDAGKALLPPQDLRNNRPFSDIHLKQYDSVENAGSEVWGGAFWQLRQVLGKDKADHLLAETWRAFSPEKPAAGTLYAAFAANLLERSKSLDDGKYAAQIRALFEQRGLRP